MALPKKVAAFFDFDEPLLEMNFCACVLQNTDDKKDDHGGNPDPSQHI
jgi:hypothetical protein